MYSLAYGETRRRFLRGKQEPYQRFEESFDLFRGTSDGRGGSRGWCGTEVDWVNLVLPTSWRYEDVKVEGHGRTLPGDFPSG